LLVLDVTSISGVHVHGLRHAHGLCRATSTSMPMTSAGTPPPPPPRPWPLRHLHLHLPHRGALRQRLCVRPATPLEGAHARPVLNHVIGAPWLACTVSLVALSYHSSVLLGATPIVLLCADVLTFCILTSTYCHIGQPTTAVDLLRCMLSLLHNLDSRHYREQRGGVGNDGEE
jgi:hypothetical protein